MTTAIQTIILAVEKLISATGDSEGTLTAALQDLKAQEANEKTEIDQLTARLTALEALSAPTVTEDAFAALMARVAALEALPAGAGGAVDLSGITDRLTALEDRNAADDAAAADLTPKNPAGLPVDPVIAVSLSPDVLADPVVGQGYTALIAAAGGSGPYAFSIAAGALPQGLILSSGGAITGTATIAGEYPVGIQAHDTNGTVATINYTMVVDDTQGESMPAAAAPSADPIEALALA